MMWGGLRPTLCSLRPTDLQEDDSEADGPTESSASQQCSVLLAQLRRLRAQTGRWGRASVGHRDGAAPCAPQCQPTSLLPSRLLRQLADKEQEWQRLARRALCSVDVTQPDLSRHRGEQGHSGGDTAASCPGCSGGARADPLLLEWLQQHGTEPSATAAVRPTATRSPSGLHPADAVGLRHLTATSPPPPAAPDARLHPAGPAGQRHPRRPLLHRDEVPAGLGGVGRGATHRRAPPAAPYPLNRRGSAYRLWAAIVRHRGDQRHGGTPAAEQ